MITTPKRVALYARVSTEDQAERQTIQAQLEFLQSWSSLYNVNVVEVYKDDGYSGTLFLTERPDSSRLLRDAETNKFDEVVVYKLDRLGRSIKVLIDAHDRLEALNITIRSATEPFDTSTPIGKFVFQLLASIAELERATIQERTSLGKANAIKRGKWPGGRIPFGWDVDEEGYVKHCDKLIEPLNLKEWEVVKWLYEEVANGSSLNKIATKFNVLKVPTTSRFSGKEIELGKLWRVDRLSDIIRNPMNKGEMIISTTHGVVSVPCPPIVNESLWDKAIAQLAKNKKLAKKNSKRYYPLRGLITCECGSLYVGTPGSDKQSHRYYRCSRKVVINKYLDATPCTSKFIRADKIESIIWDYLKRKILSAPDEAIKKAQEKLNNSVATKDNIESQRNVLIKQLLAYDRERQTILNLRRKNKISDEECEQQLDEIAQEKTHTQMLLESLKSQAEVIRITNEHLNSIAAALKKIEHSLEEADNNPELQAKLFNLLIRNIKCYTLVEGKKKMSKLVVDCVIPNEGVVIVSDLSQYSQNYHIIEGRGRQLDYLLPH